MKRRVTFLLLLTLAAQGCAMADATPKASAYEAPQSQMPEDDAKSRALAYAASKNMDVSRVEKVTAKWYPRNVDTGAGPYWSVHLSWPFDGTPDANTATIWVEEDGSCKGTWEPATSAEAVNNDASPCFRLWMRDERERSETVVQAIWPDGSVVWWDSESGAYRLTHLESSNVAEAFENLTDECADVRAVQGPSSRGFVSCEMTFAGRRYLVIAPLTDGVEQSLVDLNLPCIDRLVHFTRSIRERSLSIESAVLLDAYRGFDPTAPQPFEY